MILYHVEFLRIYLVEVKIGRIKNDEEKMGNKRVWLEVERGEKIVESNNFLSGPAKIQPLNWKENTRENGELSFWTKLLD